MTDVHHFINKMIYYLKQRIYVIKYEETSAQINNDMILANESNILIQTF